MKRGELIFNTLILPVDFIMLVLAGMVTYFLRTTILSSFRPVMFQIDLPLEKYTILVLGISLVFIAAYAAVGLYSLRFTRGLFDEFLKIIVGSSAGIMSIIVYIFLRQELFNSRFIILGAWFFSILFVAAGRLAIRLLQKFLTSRYSFGVHKVMVIGQDEVSNKILAEINNNPHTGYRIVGHTNQPNTDAVKLALANHGIDEVILANPNHPPDSILEIVDFCHENHLIFKFVPNIYQTLTTNFAVDTINGIPLIELRRTALAGWGKIIKRTLDISGSLSGLIILSPLFLIITALIKTDSDGPVFVSLDRISKNKKIKLIKFRSMVKNAEELKPQLAIFNERQNSPLFKMRNDPRITKVGKFLRRNRLDELPQLINVLLGDISLVGPRPHQPDEIANYEKHHKKVLAIKAGATGLAQISGSSDLPFDQEVNLDTSYIENWSLWWDIKIIARTAIHMFNDKSAV